ncbi:nucleotide-binding protein [Pararhizobium sp. LjRoot235]|uniref:TIR domain-containing protein n=1 Tax=Pararhizobium sp. LjRoot235 TaxID=3342291 RepID=UPI003ECD37CD
MARKTSSQAPETANMTADDMERGIRRLERRLKAVEDFDPKSLDRTDPYSTTRPLEADIETALTETFGHGTKEYTRFRLAARFDWPIFIGGEIPHHEKIEHVAKDRQRSIQLLSAAIAMLRERLEDAGPTAKQVDASAMGKLSNRIFIVHGHDNEPKEATARYLDALGYRPVILHEAANKGRTIIQKFREEASDVGFAIILLTPDDAMPSGIHRARQNVILELGFFLGQLGPHRVAAVVKGRVEVPSDFDGVVYIPFDGGWKMSLAKELEAAGYEIDWNIVMRQ